MAMTKCPECNKDVSDMANACPNCGFGVKAYFEEIKKQEQIKKQEEIQKEKIKYEKAHADEIKKQRYDKICKLYNPEPPSPPIISATIYGLIALFFVFQSVNIAFYLVAVFSILVWYFMFLKPYLVRREKYNLYLNNPEAFFKTYKEEIIKEYEQFEEQKKKEELKKLTEIMVKSHLESLAIKCPNCGSTNTQEVSMASKEISTLMVGINSRYIGKNYKCNRCNYIW